MSLGVAVGAFMLVLFAGALAGMLPFTPEPPAHLVIGALLVLNPVLFGGVALGLWGGQARAIDAEMASIEPFEALVVDVETSSHTVRVHSSGGSSTSSTSTTHVRVLEYELGGEAQRGRTVVSSEEHATYAEEERPMPYVGKVVARPADPARPIPVTAGRDATSSIALRRLRLGSRALVSARADSFRSG